MDTQLLASLGIGEKAAQVYLAGLALGTTSVQDLARKSGLKRPTVYLHVDNLVKQGLFEIVPINKKTYYKPVDPHVIEDRLKKNLQTLQAEMPRLAALAADTMGKPQVRLFEGEAGVKQIYEEIKKANSWRIWSNVGEVYEPYHSIYMELCETVKENGTNVREIIADTRESRRYARLVGKIAGSTYNVRTAILDHLENDTFIYGNVVAIFRLSGLNTFVVRIEDKTIADSMRTMFEMAWKTARPLK